MSKKINYIFLIIFFKNNLLIYVLRTYINKSSVKNIRPHVTFLYRWRHVICTTHKTFCVSDSMCTCVSVSVSTILHFLLHLQKYTCLPRLTKYFDVINYFFLISENIFYLFRVKKIEKSNAIYSIDKILLIFI